MLVGNQRLAETTQVNQVMPVRAVTRQPCDFQGDHDPDLTARYRPDQSRKPQGQSSGGSAGTAFFVITVFSSQTDENTVSQRVSLKN